MIEISDVRAELKKITATAVGKKGDKQKASEMFMRLQGAVMDDISKTGDQRTRLLFKLLTEYKLPS